MTKAWWIVCLAAAMCGLAQVPASAERDGAQETIESHLGKLSGAELGALTRVERKRFEKSLPDLDFFALRFERYPREIVPDPPLRPNNLFAVKNRKVTQVVSEKQLEEFLKRHLAPAPNESARADATRVWLHLVQELHKDGFFEFQEPTVRCDAAACEGVVEVVPKRGDRGRLTVRLSFDGGKLKDVTPGGKLVPGVRPRCQATHLLHEDPLIREIMRQDILVMGRSCKAYLDEARRDADPDLRRAIDALWREIVAREKVER